MLSNVLSNQMEHVFLLKQSERNLLCSTMHSFSEESHFMLKLGGFWDKNDLMIKKNILRVIEQLSSDSTKE